MPQHWEFQATSAIAPHLQHGTSEPVRTVGIQALPIQVSIFQGAKL